jgi:stringent starvation protein B
MSPTQPLPPKKDVALALLERSSVYVHLDPRQPDVTVPPWFKKKPQLVLQIGLNMAVPITDLRLDDSGISCTLSFNRAPFFCVVPWASVFAMVGDDGRGMVWPEDVPAEVARQQGRVVEGEAQKEQAKALQGSEPEAEPPKLKRSRRRPALAAVAELEKDGGVKPIKTARPAPERPSHANHATASRPAVAPAPRSSPSDARKKGKKRELPSYLRVVK